MPSASNFLAGFGFLRGSQIDGYIISSATSTEDTVKRYQEYHYSITLVFHNLGNGDYNELFAKVDDMRSQEHIIYGVKNPYRCIIDPINNGDVTGDNEMLTFKLTGHSYRSH